VWMIDCCMLVCDECITISFFLWFLLPYYTVNATALVLFM
jgi:hypothetical protein